jgi:hypothetical protein
MIYSDLPNDGNQLLGLAFSTSVRSCSASSADVMPSSAFLVSGGFGRSGNFGKLFGEHSAEAPPNPRVVIGKNQVDLILVSTALTLSPLHSLRSLPQRLEHHCARSSGQ